MRLKKVIINGKTYYKDLDEKEVVQPEVIDPKTEKNEKNRAEYKKEQRSKTNFFSKENLDKSLKEFDHALSHIGENISKGVGTAKNWIIENTKSKDLTNKLVKILPYMDEEDVHELVDKIINDDPEFKELNVTSIMPFLDDDDCNRIFLKYLKEEKEIPIGMVHYVSEDYLSLLVDSYIAGKYPDLDVDALYPFLDGDDVKKLFYYEIKKNKKQSDD